MGYILKNTAALINTKLTDAARKKISEGKFNISYFQVGDSEIDYNALNVENLVDNFVLQPNYTAQNIHPGNTNKSAVKYPVRVSSDNTNAFGIPFNNSTIEVITNTASPVGFFSTGTTTTNFNEINLGEQYLISPDYVVDSSLINGTNQITIPQLAGVEIESGYVLVFVFNNSQIIDTTTIVLTYRVVERDGDLITLDRNLPDYTSYPSSDVMVLVYPDSMVPFYDSETPEVYWNPVTFTFEGICDSSLDYVKIWNMNIPWSEIPAGIFSSVSNTNFGSKEYLGTKEYLGYTSTSGQTLNSNVTYYVNSLKERVDVTPEEQKAIAIIHYTNNTIDNFYGEKLADNLKLHLPWLMWHKSTTATIGETFYVKPPATNESVEGVITSLPNSDMNEPGIRYYHLWDSNEDNPSRVGKVFPDLKIITIDDEELVAAMSYKSNRNWTLPAPKLGLVLPNTFNGVPSSDNGLLDTTEDTLWVTYRLDSDTHKSLHCNYYVKIHGTDTDCPPDTANVTVKFGSEFPFLTDGSELNGFNANKIILISQYVTSSSQRPNPTLWREMDVTSQIPNFTLGDNLTPENIYNTTFQIVKDEYDSADIYDLSEYISLPEPTDEDTLNFGDEYFFYGTVETDILATIYVMNYLCNLSANQFLTSTNPTWSEGQDIYISEVGLYDDEKDLMIISKIQSPQQRLGVQQYSIKLDI
jgi:hypothetical protein